MFKSILVPLDRHNTAQRGLQTAIGLASALGAKLTLLHVVSGVMMVAELAAVNAAELHDSLRKSGEDLLAKAKRVAAEAGLPAETVLVDMPDGPLQQLVVDEARKADCDLIVMGTHGREGLARFVLGSEAELVVRGSEIPVLLVPDPPPA